MVLEAKCAKLSYYLTPRKLFLFLSCSFCLGKSRGVGWIDGNWKSVPITLFPVPEFAPFSVHNLSIEQPFTLYHVSVFLKCLYRRIRRSKYTALLFVERAHYFFLANTRLCTARVLQPDHESQADNSTGLVP